MSVSNGKRKLAKTAERGYGAKYQRMRKALLASKPACHWCGASATTADHEPPIAEAGIHYNLVPACAPCNLGRRGNSRRFVPTPSRDWYGGSELGREARERAERHGGGLGHRSRDW